TDCRHVRRSHGLTREKGRRTMRIHRYLGEKAAGGPYSTLVFTMVDSGRMETSRKITVEVPPDLLERAQRATDSGITQTVRAGLEVVAESRAYAQLRQFRGKVRF